MSAGEQAMENRQYDSAVKHFQAARKLYPKADKRLQDAQFSQYMEKSREALVCGDLDRARREVESALSLRKDNPEATKLHEGILRRSADQRMADGEKAMQARDFDKAVECFKKAMEVRRDDQEVRDLLVQAYAGNSEQAEAAGELDKAIGELDKALAIRRGDKEITRSRNRLAAEIDERKIQALLREAGQLKDKRQYDQAFQKAQQALDIRPEHKEASNLRDEIDRLRKDPRTTNLSGFWRAPSGAICKLEDNGKTVTCEVTKLPEHGEYKSCSGTWSRNGAILDGKFRVVWAKKGPQGIVTTGRVHANIKAFNILSVKWREVEFIDPNGRTWEAHGYSDWAKQE
jgi:tetratricopeptide (TPR) repeat protein